MIKRAQGYSSFGGAPALYGRTLSDLYREIRRDTALSQYEQTQLIHQIEGVTNGMAPSTPIATLMARGLGGVVGYLIGKYFSLGPVGQAVVTALGVGLGKKVYDQFNQPPDAYAVAPGWERLH